MLWLALHLPRLSLEAFCCTLPAEALRRPVALIDDHRVHSVNRAAAACGIKPGFKRATALALAGDLQLADREPVRDTAALLAVAHAALAFTPSVNLHDGQTVLLEVQASLRLFGGLGALCQRLRAALAPLRHLLHIAAAPTAMGAVLLAQWHPRDRGELVDAAHATELKPLQQLLADAPVWLLGPGREHWEALQGMGLKTLADLRCLPRSGVARRFGVEVLTDLSRAFGEQPDPRSWQTLPPVFESRLELFTRAENTDQVLHGAKVLLARLVGWAQAQHARVRAFTLRMLHERQRQVLQPPTELVVALAEPGLDAAHLQLLLRERLGRLQLLMPTLELQLVCRDISVLPAPNGELFPTRASEAEGLVRLVERLRARLGDDQVLRLVPVADHRPERATEQVPLVSARTPEAATLAAVLAQAPVLVPGSPEALRTAADELPTNNALYHPTWLLPEPLPLAERDASPLLQGRPLQLLSGPERIESGWWDGGLVARDYYIAQTEQGALVWLFRSRVPLAPGEVIWHLQGRFG